MTTAGVRPPPVTEADTVLVVEDETFVRLAVAQYLRDCGYRVIEAANADEALAVLSEPAIAVAIILSAVEMPGSMDGFGLSQWVRRHRKELDDHSGGQSDAGGGCRRRPLRIGTDAPQAV